MAPIALENEDHGRDAAFNKVLHGKSAEERGGIRSMLKKDPAAQKAAIEEYFKHWDNKAASTETEEIREVCRYPFSILPMLILSQSRKAEYATLTRQWGFLAPRQTISDC